MLLYLVFAPLALFALLILFLYLKQEITVRKVYNVKNGSIVPHANIFGFFKLLTFGNREESLFIQSSKSQRGKGDVVLIWILFTPCVQVRSPELATFLLKNTQIFEKTIPISWKDSREFIGTDQLVFANGHNWMRQRKILDPAFMALKNYEKIFDQKTKIVLKRLQEKEGIIGNTSDLTQRMALDILGLSIFGHDFNALLGSSKEDLDSYNLLMEAVNSPGGSFYYVLKEKFAPWHENKKLQDALKVFNGLSLRLIEESKNSKSKNFSMLDMMVASQNNEDGLSDKEIKDNISIFFLAGHETTANALSFAIYNLAEYPDLQEEMRKDVQEALKGKETTFEETKNIDSLNFFIKENMRMFPPIIFIPAKKTTQDTQIGDYFIPKGFLVNVNVYEIQHSKEIYGDPDTFRPSRWRKEESKNFPFGSWLPFSLGKRICIGQDFSLMEQRIFLSEFLLNYKVSKIDSKEKVRVDPHSALFQTPKNYPLKFEKIN